MVGKSAVQSASYLLWLQHVLVKRFWKPNWLLSVASRCKDLQALAPSAEQLVRNFLIDMKAVNEMLRDQLQTGIGIAKGATGATFAQGGLLFIYCCLQNLLLRKALKTPKKKNNQSTPGGGSHSDVACRWVQRHADIWQTWLPDPTKCFAGFGLYHQATKSFMQDRSNTSGLTCQACPSGRVEVVALTCLSALFSACSHVLSMHPAR